MKHEAIQRDLLNTFAIKVRPNGRVMLVAPYPRIPVDTILGGCLYLDFRPLGYRLYFLLPETSFIPGSEMVIGEYDRYDLSLAMRLERQKLVDIVLYEKMSFNGIHNYMATCRLFR